MPMTRAMSRRFGWRRAGRGRFALSYAAVDDQAVVDSTNAQLSRGSAEPIPQLSLSVTRELMIASGRLYCLVRLRNFLRERVTTTASLAVAADFADMFEVRGGVRRPARGHATAPKRTGRGLVLAYVGEDEIFRESGHRARARTG
jgi:glycogen debranching enzyme